MPLMTEANVKLTAYVRERIRRALNIHAARRGKSVGDVISELVLSSLARDLELADEELGGGAEPAKGRPGRKPKPPSP